MYRILPIDTPTPGDRSYLVHDLAATEGVSITHVFETHIHNVRWRCSG